MVDPELYPFRGRHFDRGGGVRLHYLDEGQGDPVVMLHGNPTWSFFFRRLVLELRGRYRCVVPDHVGCGLSDKPPLSEYDYSLASRVDDLTRLLEHAGVGDRVTLVLHDWGGMIGLAWAARNAARVSRLVLMNTAGFRLPAAKRLPRLLRFGRDSRVGRHLILRHNAFCRVAAVRAAAKPLPPAVRAAYLAPYDSPEHRVAVLRFVQSIPLAPGDEGYDIVTEVEAGLERLAGKPTLILWGMRDFVFDRHFLDEWRRRLPAAEVREFPAAGHYLTEDEADAVPESVARFLG